jgi:hypothetical protein
LIAPAQNEKTIFYSFLEYDILTEIRMLCQEMVACANRSFIKNLEP